MYDYGARNYDPALGRFGTMDGKGELYFSSSPYVYASNTPVQAIDPDGNIVILLTEIILEMELQVMKVGEKVLLAITGKALTIIGIIKMNLLMVR